MFHISAHWRGNAVIDNLPGRLHVSILRRRAGELEQEVQGNVQLGERSIELRVENGAARERPLTGSGENF